MELERWVNEIEGQVWEERVKEEEEGWAWGDYELGIEDSKGVKLKDEDVRKGRGE